MTQRAEQSRAEGPADRLSFRRVTAADVEACAALAAGDADGWSAGALAEEAGQSASRLFAAQAGGVTAAFCVFQLVLDEASLLAVHTAPAYRRQGVARALLQYAFASMAREGCETVFLEVRSRNDAALALYRRLGFERVGLRRDFYQKPADDAVVMRWTRGARSPAAR